MSANTTTAPVLQAADTGSKLNQFDVTILVISFVVGMGIFGTPARVAAASGSPALFFSVWLVGGFVALCGALTYAEIGLRLPAMGGYYKIFSFCYHPSIGFTINALILISNAASLAVVALIGADYISDLLYGKPSGSLFNTLVAVFCVGIFFVVNLLGLRTSSRTQNVLMILKIGLMLLMIASIIKGVTVPPHGHDSNIQVYDFKDNHWLKLFLIACIPVFFSYGGYQQTINFGTEVKRTNILSKGIVSGMIIVVALYMAINYAYTEVIGFEEMKGTSAIGALLLEAWFGTTGAKIFDALMFLSVLAYVNVVLLSNPRVMRAMSLDKVFPKMFAYQHPKTKAMINGLAAFSVMTIIITFFGKQVDNILGFTMFLDSFGMGASAATLFYLRKKKQNENAINKGFIKTITPLLAAIFVLAYAGIATAVIIDKPTAAIIGLSLLGALAIIYFLVYHKKGSTNNL
jgi:APA family basic amino acid/polyamine antiporter